MWDERYNTKTYVYGTEPNEFLRKSMLDSKQGEVLSLAEGEGRNAVFLAQLGHKVTAVDASKVGLKKAEQLAATRGVDIKTVVQNLDSFIFEPEKWDYIISIFCHLSPDLRKKVYHGAVKSLKPGGLLIIEAYSKKQLQYGTGGPKDIDLLIDKNELEDELKGLNFLRSTERMREVNEGIFHNGAASVVQLVGQKPGRENM